MRLELEEALKTREDYLLEQLKSQQSELEVERTALIQRLEAEMSDRLVEKDKNVLIEEELRLQKEKLDKVRHHNKLLFSNVSQMYLQLKRAKDENVVD